MQCTQIYMIILMILAGMISIQSLVEIARIALFNQTIFDSMTQDVSEAWILAHPLLFVSIKITLFLATIQISLFIITTYANYKKLAACKCLIYFLPLFGLTGIISSTMFLACESGYTKPLMALAKTDMTTCTTFECSISAPFERVWADTLIYLVFYACTLAAYLGIFIKRTQEIFKGENEGKPDRNSEKNGKHIIDTDLEIDNVSQIYI